MNIQAIKPLTTEQAENEAVAFQNRMAALSVSPDAPAPTQSELATLPPELIAELRGTEEMELEQQVVDCLEVSPRADLDRILIALYHRHKRIIKRTKLSSLLNRLIQDGEVVRVSRGVYAIPSTTDNSSVQG